jgi:hypothetical protein
MKNSRRLLGFAVFLVVFAFGTAAFAQGTAPAPVSEATGVIMGLSALLGVLTNWIQTGTLLGRWITPKTWLPDVTMLTTFLGGFVGFITSQTPVALTGTAIYEGVLAGIAALTAGAAPALARHVHANLNESQRQMLAAMKKPVVAAAAAALLLIGLGVMQTACSQPAVPVLVNVVQVVETDLQAGDGLPQIDSDVCKALGGSATTDAICANVTVLVEDALQLLLDGGKLPPAQAQMAQTYIVKRPGAMTTSPATTGGGK